MQPLGGWVKMGLPFTARTPLEFAMPRWLLAALFIPPLLTGCDWPWSPSTNAAAIVCSGTVEVHESALGFEIPGRIKAIEAHEGQTVAAGQVLVRLDDRDAQLALAQMQAQVREAQSVLDQMLAGARPEELAMAQAALDKARAVFALAKADRERLRNLAMSASASRERLDQSETQYTSAQAEVARATQALQLLKAGPRQEEIDRARSRLDGAQTGLKQAQRRLDQTVLMAPVAGIVSADLSEVGEVVAPGKPVLRLADLAHPWIRAYLNEPDLGRVKLGQGATVKVDGQPHPFQGRLAFIADQSEFTPKAVQTQELRVGLVYRIKIEVPNPDGILKIGMPVEVELAPVGGVRG